MDRQGMVKQIMMCKDLTDVGTWMMEAIPETVDELSNEVFGYERLENGEVTDEEWEEFYKALWTALFKANAQ